MDNPQHNLGINGQNEITQSYDLIAIQPETEKMFQVACTNLEIDIISLDMTAKLAFPLRHGYVKVAMQRGVVFELLYGPMIRDPGMRRHTIGNALGLLRTNKGRSTIVSSGAMAPWQIRAPADVMNLTSLFGVQAHRRKETLTVNPNAAFMNGATRKHTYRGAAYVVPTDQELAAESTDMLQDFISF